MSRSKWVRTITVTTADLAAGDWESRDRNPIALAIARVLRPGATLFVDADEYFICYGTHREWFCLPDRVIEYARSVIHEGHTGELKVDMGFAPWAIVTERSARKARRGEPHAEDSDEREPE